MTLATTPHHAPTLRLTHQAYRAWLLRQPPAQVMAKAYDCYGCPLAVWLSAMHPQATRGAWVGERTWQDDTGRTRALPPWARQYVRRVDRSGENAITAAMALRLLEESTHAA